MPTEWPADPNDRHKGKKPNADSRNHNVRNSMEGRQSGGGGGGDQSGCSLFTLTCIGVLVAVVVLCLSACKPPNHGQAPRPHQTATSTHQ